MSLAAALAADGVRPVSFLPSIKCSDCGIEIEISDMGSHICEQTSPPPPPPKSHKANMSNPFTLRKLNASGQQPTAAPSPLQQSVPVAVSSPPSGRRPSKKASRTNLPRINSEAANQPFLAPRQPHQALPLSPAVSVRSGSSNDSRPGVLRSATSPVPRLFGRPPSPELSANLDCAFPPFPTPSTPGRRPSAPTISSGRKTPTGSDRAPSRGGTRLDQVENATPDLFELRSPNPHAGENVLRRMNTLRSGPFTSRRHGSGDSKGESAVQEKRRPSVPAIDETPTQTATSNPAPSEVRRPSSPTAGLPHPPPPSRPERPDSEDVLSPGFLKQLNMEPLYAEPLPLHNLEQIRPIDRSNTFPKNDESPRSSQTLSRMRSEPAMRKPGRRPSLAHGAHGSISEQSDIPRIHTPSRTDSRNAPRIDPRIQDAPPVPRAIEQYRHERKHTPTDSSSSISSASHSTPHTDGSGDSPAVSVASSLDTFSNLNYEHESYGNEEKMRVTGLSVKDPQTPGMRAEQPVQRSPPRTTSRNAAPLKAPQRPQTPLESPMDPAMLGLQSQTGTTYEPWQASDSRPNLARTKTAPGPIPTANSPFPAALSIPQKPDHDQSMMSQSAPAREITRPRAPSAADSQYSSYSATSSRPAVPDTLRPPPTPSSRQPAGRRTTNAKPICRGCNHMIEGKSVKAADGRLTGRWHKACFVCKSCQQPFVTADFYVINNHPYCEQHYHEENGSLCHGCNRGIEGQYLETSSSTRYGSVDRKYHPRCFTCCQCRTVLAQDYFEITGQVFCERHALAAMRARNRLVPGGGPPGPGGLNPMQDRRGLMAERRTTRLINPMMA